MKGEWNWMNDITEDFWKLSKVLAEIEDAFSTNPKHEHAEYLNRIAKILGVIE